MLQGMGTQGRGKNRQGNDEKEKRKLVEIKHVPKSDLPHRVVNKRNGVTLGSFETVSAAMTFIDNLSIEKLRCTVTRRRAN